jgi:hypothetical protein
MKSVRLRRVLPALFFLALSSLKIHAGTPAAAARDALQAGQALCKVISPTDAGTTGSNQAGLYLPKAAWRFFTSSPPVEDENRAEPTTLTWPDGSVTEASLRWYGKGTRSEFRLTRLGDRLSPDTVGDLLVLIPAPLPAFRAHLLRTEAAAADFCTTLGLEPGQRWSFYEKAPASPDTKPANGIAAWAAREAQKHNTFPTGRAMAALARQAVEESTPKVLQQSADHRLQAWLDAEYLIYQAIERRVCADQIRQDFTNVEDFLAAAATLTNRRKSRAGHSLEAHVEYLFQSAGIAFDAQATIDGNGKPDLLFPGKAAYNDPAHPVADLLVLGLKTTCRDRWRQVLNEGQRLPIKHLLTLQPAMSKAQLKEMQEAGLQLIVPAALQSGYEVPDGYQILTVEEFTKDLRRRFPQP